jgi:hypothetical protein
VLRLTAVPAHNKKPVGAVAVGHIVMLPDGEALAITKAVVASCVVLVPKEAVGAAGVPVKVGDKLLAFVATAVTRLLNSASSSVPLTIFRALPVERLSLDAKFVLFV